MRKFLAAFGIVLMLSGAAYADLREPIPVQQHEEMLYPTVLVAVGTGSGSGTVIFSERIEGEYMSLVLTNWHVVASAVQVSEEWDPQKKQKVEKETRRPVKIEIFEYNNYSTSIGTTGRTAQIVGYDKKRDLALLRIDDRERPLEHVATLYPEDMDDGPWIFQKAFAVGAGLGKPPFPTMGLLSGYGRDQNGNALYLSSSPIIFGNSGGSLFVYSPRNSYEMVGVPSMVSAYGWGSVVSHMAWSRPISEIRIFLRANKFGFILGDKPEQEEIEDNDQ